MYLARHLVALIVGLILTPLYTCLVLPGSSLSLAARDTESSSISSLPESTWSSDNATFYGSSTDRSSLDKRSNVVEFQAKFNGPAENSWEISMNFTKAGQHDPAGIMKNTSQALGSGSYGVVSTGTWERFGSCDGPVPVAIKLSKKQRGYNAARHITRIKSPYVVGVYQYAMTQNDESLVAYERLGQSAWAAWHAKTLKPVPLFKDVLQGALAGAEMGVFHMDIKLDNILRGDKDIWKLIDWDLFIAGSAKAQINGHMGANGYMSPEMMALKLKKSKTLPMAGPSQVFMLGSLFFEVLNPRSDGTITPEMDFLRKEIDIALPTKEGFHPGRKNYVWFWMKIQLAHFNGKASPEEILELLPWNYRKGLKSKWGKWFSKLLCNTEQRYTLQEAWKAFGDLKLG